MAMLTIRKAVEQDGAALAAIYEPYVSDTVISFEAVPPTSEEFGERIAKCLPTYPWLIAEVHGQIAGYAYAGSHSGRAAYDWSADISVYLAPAYHRQGIGRTLYEALIALLRYQGYHALFSGITLPNEASIAIHSAIGMREVGVYREVGFKFSQWHDVLWMGMTISPPAHPTAQPTPFAALTNLQHIVPISAIRHEKR